MSVDTVKTVDRMWTMQQEEVRVRALLPPHCLFVDCHASVRVSPIAFRVIWLVAMVPSR